LEQQQVEMKVAEKDISKVCKLEVSLADCLADTMEQLMVALKVGQMDAKRDTFEAA
jgi:hypothetical protein